jgi:integrase
MTPLKGVPSLAKVRALVTESGLASTRTRDLVSAVNRICAMAGVSPEALLASPEALRPVLAKIKPAAHGISGATFSKVRSNLNAALVVAGVIDPVPRGLAKKDPRWEILLAAIADDKRLSNGLAGFANYCVLRDVAPTAATDETVQRFQQWLETRTLVAKPRDKVRLVPSLWRQAKSRGSGWPQTELRGLSFRKPNQHFNWRQFAISLAADADVYLSLRRQPDLFAVAGSAPRRPLADSTLRQQREHLRIAASLVARQQGGLEQVQQLADLVTPDAFKTVLRHFHDRAEGRPSAFAISIAKTLMDVARFHVGVSPDHLAELKRLAGKLPAVPLELTEKNTAMIANLDSDRMRAALYRLPEVLLSEVARKLDAPRLAFVLAQAAIAVDILLVAPLRPQNLSNLNWRRHFSAANGPRGRLLLHIPAIETKSKKRELIFELPPDVAQRLRWYRKQILPRLGADPNGDLFVVEGGKLKAQVTLSQQVCEVINKRVGLDLTIHQFRHIAAVSYLEDHPEDFETVRELLGHSWSKTTRIYAGNGSKRASRVFGAFIVTQREKLHLKGKRPRKPRRT